MKTCTRCGEAKPLDEFNKRARATDGHHPYCKPCLKAYNHDYYKRNPEKYAAYEAKKDREAQRVYLRAYYRKNKSAHLAAQRKWRQGHKEELRVYEQRRNREAVRARQLLERNGVRRSQKRAAPSEPINRDEIYDRDGGRCHLCGGKVPRTGFHLDHLIPLSQGGGYLRENLRVAHPACNLSRGPGRLPAQLLLIG